MYTCCRPLARFQTDEQQERLVQLLIEERRIRSRLALLHEWCSLGLKTAKEVEVSLLFRLLFEMHFLILYCIVYIIGEYY